MEKIYDLIIIGGGPAGLTAALYASRSGLSTLIFEQGAPGGKLMVTAEIENWPGTKSAKGFELAQEMEEHALAFGAELKWGVVSKIENASEDIKTVHTMDGPIQARAILLATGSLERKLGIPGEDEYTGRGVSYCAVCDGAFFRDKRLHVIGGGNTAYEEGNYLTDFASSVDVFMRRDVARCDQIHVDRVASNPKMAVHVNLKPVEILGDDEGVTSVRYVDSHTGEETVIETDGVFPFIGVDPVSQLYGDPEWGLLDDDGYVLTDETMATKIPGLYAAGDVRQKSLRQVVTATGDGATAAQAIVHYLRD